MIIPTFSDPFYSIRVTLDGESYRLIFKWHSREERWFLSILDAEDQPLLESIKLLVGWPLGEYHKGSRALPPGVLVVSSTTEDKSPPGLDELGEGKRCELNYYPQVSNG